MSTIDPIQLALVQDRLDYIARHMGWVMTRTARSPIFSQSHDFSCFLTDPHGTLVSQADGIPIHTGGGGFAVRAILGKFVDQINDGDVFLLNDPYVGGGNHLPDWVIARPVFKDASLVSFACNRAHQSDIGGGAAGTYNPEATEIFHEGIRLPPLKLVDREELRHDLWQMLLINSRTPELLDGDLRAMLGSTQIGADELSALFDELGRGSALAYFEGILDHGEMLFRNAIRQLPDGVYEAEEMVDNDCFESMEIPVRASLTVDVDRLLVDLSASAPQMKGFKNSSLANTYSAVYMAVASYFDAELPKNEGSFRCIEIIAPEGSVVNARPPAPVTMCTVFIAHEIIHVIWKALAKADPDNSCAGWGKSIHGVCSGSDPRTSEPFVMYHWNCMPAGGAIDGRDGFNQIGHLIALGGLQLPNLETYEQLYPVQFLRQEFRCDGGGPGKYRGGTGIEYAVNVEVPAEYSFRGEGLYSAAAFGINGGHDGTVGFMQIEPVTGEPFAPPKYAKRSLPALLLTASSPGGGGWGDPKTRDPDMVAMDVKNALVSEEQAKLVYGFSLPE